MRSVSFVTSTLALIAGSAFAIAQAPGATPLVVHQLKPNVYWVEGGGGNSTVIVGDKGVIVIDAKISRANGAELVADIAKITPKPIDAVFITHSDQDHINGLVAFPAGVKIIAHEGNKKEQEEAIAQGGNNIPAADRLPNEVVTKQKQTFTIDGETIETYHWGPGHTNGDLVMYLPKEKVVATGDLFTTQGPDTTIHAAKNGTSEGWIANGKGIAALDSDLFILGHGDPQNKAWIQGRLAHLEEKRAKIKELMAQGKSLDEVRAAFNEPVPVAGPNGRMPNATFTEVVYTEFKK